MKARQTPMKRSAPPKRKQAPKVCNRGRRKKRFAENYGSRERVLWLMEQPCVVQVEGRMERHHRACDGKIENAHVGTGGMGLKAKASSITSLCARHHRLLHELGAKTFAGMYNVNLKQAAAQTEHDWQAHLSRTSTPEEREET